MLMLLTALQISVTWRDTFNGGKKEQLNLNAWKQLKDLYAPHKNTLGEIGDNN